MDEKFKKVQKENEQGIALANSGKLMEAIGHFNKALKISPNFNSYFSLALAYQLMKNYEKSKKYYLKSLEISPGFSMAHNNLGAIYIEEEKYEKAIEHFKQAIKSESYNALAFNNLGNAYRNLNKFDLAIKNYIKAIDLQPTFVDAINNIALIYFEKKNYKKAANNLRKILETDPSYAPAYYHLGMVSEAQKDYKNAANSYENYRKIMPNDEKAIELLVKVYEEMGQNKKAIKCYKQAIEINPNSPTYYNELGNLYERTNLLDKALECYKKAVKIDPKLEGVLNNVGVIYFKQEKYDTAIKWFEKAIAINPKYKESLYHLGLIYERTGNLNLAATYLSYTIRLDPKFSHALNILVDILAQKCDWDEYDKMARKLDRLTTEELKNDKKPGEVPFVNVIRNPNPKRNYEIAKAWSDSLKKNIGHSFPHPKKGKEKKKLTIGYLSADFQDHATAHLILGLFEAHDRKRFKVYIYSYGPDDGSYYRRKIKADADKFVDVSDMENEDAATIIYKDGVDILIDLKGYTRKYRFEIAAYKPAPIIIDYLGFPGTTGADFIDYVITDKIITPVSQQKYFSEKFIYMPQTYQINDNKQKISSRKYKKKDFGLPEKAFVFSSFNQSYKITRETFALWMKILKKTKNSVLWLMQTNPNSQTYLKMAAKKAGVDPERVIFSGKLDKADHLARLKLTDVALDPLTCNGHTTTSDYLWAGVPVITLQGKHFASRVAASLITAAGLAELVTKEKSEYERLAMGLAKNKKKLKTVKDKLAANRLTCPLFDTEKQVKNLEKAYKKVWEIYEKGKESSIILVKE